MSGNVDVIDLVRRAVKYLFEGLVVAFVAGILPNKPLSLEEILLLGLVAATTFSILDTFIPSVAASARQGAGLGLGANLVGFPAM